MKYARSYGSFMAPAGAVALAVLLLATGACERSPAGTEGRDLVEGAVDIRSSIRSPTVNTLVVEVTAPDIPDPVVFNLDLQGSDTDGDGTEDEFTASEVLTVPAGADRLFTVRAFDVGGVQSHEGSTTMDVTPGANASAVVVTLRPLAGDQPIDIVLGDFEVTVDPVSATVGVDATQQFTAEVTDENGPVSGATVLWATTNPGVATVDADGLATGVAEGGADIVATYGGVAATGALTVAGASTAEVCDGIDNDGDQEVDEGYPYCVDGQVASNTDGVSCLPGYEDANGDPADGCETELTLTTYYLDADGDGYGDPGVTTTDYTQPQGYVATAGDCDDGDPNVHPGAQEVQDGIDNDCDQVIDETS